MKHLFPKKVAVLCLSAVMSLAFSFGVMGLLPVGAASATKYDVTEITDTYLVDTSVTVSNTADATKTVFPKEISIDGATATVATLKYPDGYERSVGDELVLDQLGKYTITYKTANNLYYFDTFKVLNNFAELSGNGQLKNFEVEGTVMGVTAVMEPGTQITFNKVIDLTDVDPETGCVDLFSAKFNTLNGSSVLVKYTELIIEDVNDPNVFIKFLLQQDYNMGYLRVSTKDLAESSLYKTSSEGEALSGTKKALVTYINGVRYKNFFGRSGRRAGKNVDSTIRYNPVTQELYQDKREGEHSVDNLFADLDNVDAFDQGAKLFEGFPSKAVKLTVRGNEYNEAFSLDFTQIGDSQGENLASLMVNGVNDSKAPILEVNSVPTTAGTIFGKFGSKFSIPTATAIDFNGASTVAINVYKNYVEASKVYVPLQDDGTLLLNEQTVYTIEYSSFDRYGNLAVETLNVVPKITTPLAEYDVMVDSNIRLGANKITLISGQNCNAKIFEEFSTLNSASALTLDVDVTHAGKSVYSKSFDNNDIKEGNLQFDFLPIAVGDYVVTYTYGDNVEHGTFNYTVVCASENKINFKEKPFLYRTYTYGMEYDVSQHVGYQFGDTLEENPTTVEISYDNGTTWTQVDKTFVVGKDANGEVPLTKTVDTIKFRYTSGSNVQTTDNATIVDVRKDTTKPLSLVIKDGVEGNLDYTKYLYTDEFEISETPQRKYVFDAKNTSGSAVLKVNNPITFNKKGEFITLFNTFTELNNFNKVTITLIDAYDPTNVLNFYYEVILGETFIYTDTSRKFCITDFPLFSLDPEKNLATLDFSYNVNNRYITSCGKQFSAEFLPTNNLFYVEYTLGGISGSDAAISLTDVSNAALSSRTVVDNKSPVFCYQSSAGTYALGTTVTIFAPQATDFCTPYAQKGRTSIKVTINNKPIESVDGTLLNGIDNDPTKNYDILIDQLLIYKVTYTVVDDAGKSDTISYSIQGADKVNPVITLGYDFNENTIHNVTLGKPFTIDYTISDNVSPAENCLGRVVILNDKTSRLIYAAEPMEYAENSEDYTLITDTCTITVKGMYTVYVYAQDEAGNTVYASYKLNVQ